MEVKVVGLNDKVKELLSLVKETAEYKDLKQARAVIDKNSTLKNELEAFNKRQTELYSSRMSSKEAEVVISELNKKYGYLSKNPEVEKFLKSLKQFNEMMGKIYKSMGDLIEADLKSK